MRVQYPKMYNMTHLALNVLLIPKDLTVIFISIIPTRSNTINLYMYKTIKVGNDQEMDHSERNSQFKNPGAKKINKQLGIYTKKYIIKKYK